jgi:hypothetical protein
MGVLRGHHALRVRGFLADGLQVSFKARETCVQRVGEASFFLMHHFRYALRVLFQFRISAFHQVADGEDHLIHEWFFGAEKTSMTDAATQDFAQHVAAAFIGRDHAVSDKKGGGASVIGDDAQ